jgi:hypothetical protein
MRQGGHKRLVPAQWLREAVSVGYRLQWMMVMRDVWLYI